MQNKSLKVCLVGIGNIGYYHLLSLLKYSRFLDIIVIDKKEKNFIKIKKIFSNKLLARKGIKLKYSDKINFKNQIFDFLILATTSDARLIIIKKILKKNEIKNILVEKIAASNFAEYQKMKKIFKENKIKNYINFPRREYKVYNFIKNKLNSLKIKKIRISYIGYNWNLASNVFHLIDLTSFLTNNKKFSIKINKLKDRAYLSSRKFFYELKGKLVFENNHGSTLVCEDIGYKKENRLNQSQPITIEANNLVFKIYENLHKLKIFKKNNHSFITKKIRIPNQSQLTDQFMKKIINKTSKLPTFKDSYYIHKLLLNTFARHIKIKLNKNLNKVKIT